LPPGLELRRVGRGLEWHAYLRGRFLAIVSRACYTRALGASWVVTVRPGLPRIGQVFRSRADAVEALSHLC
jgi:hypothetical protein